MQIAVVNCSENKMEKEYSLFGADALCLLMVLIHGWLKHSVQNHGYKEPSACIYMENMGFEVVTKICEVWVTW